MTEQTDTRSGIVAAVQQELNRFGKQVSAEFQRLQSELAAERSARARTEETITALLPAIGQLAHHQDQLEQDLSSLDRIVHKFDGQAAALVQHVNAITEATETRLDEVSAQAAEHLEVRFASLATRMDEVSAQAARRQAEVSNAVGARVDQAEERVNDRILTVEARINETLGQRVAGIDAYVGRVSAGLDEAVATLSDRITAAESRFDDVNQAIDAMGACVDLVDVDAIDEMKDRIAGAAGQAELVRIEVERFQKSMGESMDKTLVRIVELESQLQEQHMDVEAAVQLERLEEVERALIALDPSQFVRRTDALRHDDPMSDPATPLTAPDPFAPQAAAQS